MKKILFQTLLFATCFISCRQTEMESPKATGTLALEVSNLTDYITVESKADGQAVDFTNTADYDVVIEGPTKKNMKYSEFIGQVIELGSGTYTITVTSPLTEPAAFEQPIYQAHDSFVIKAGEVTPLTLTCTPYNCKVTIELSENFKKELATYEVVISNGLGELVWTKDETKDDFGENKAGYFLPRGLEVKVKGHRSIDNTEATAIYYVQDPQPAEHHIIKLDAKVTGQIGGITISVVTTFNQVDNDIEVPGMDESYVDRPDFNGDEDDEEVETAKNEIIWSANPLFEDYPVTADSQIAMTINMPAGIASFVVKVNHADFQNALTMFTGDVDGDGNKENYIDLINDTEFATNIKSVDPEGNLPVGDEILGQTSVEFNLTCFVPLLCSTAPGQTIPFVLEAYDMNGDPLLFMDDFPVITLITPAK